MCVYIYIYIYIYIYDINYIHNKTVVCLSIGNIRYDQDVYTFFCSVIVSTNIMIQIISGNSNWMLTVVYI